MQIIIVTQQENCETINILNPEFTEDFTILMYIFIILIHSPIYSTIFVRKEVRSANMGAKPPSSCGLWWAEQITRAVGTASTACIFKIICFVALYLTTAKYIKFRCFFNVTTDLVSELWPEWPLTARPLVKFVDNSRVLIYATAQIWTNQTMLTYW